MKYSSSTFAFKTSYKAEPNETAVDTLVISRNDPVSPRYIDPSFNFLTTGTTGIVPQTAIPPINVSTIS